MMYADIKGFTEYSNRHTAQQVVVMLSKLFTSFDELCIKHKVYKVYTIGDCYVVMSFLDKERRKPEDYPNEAMNVMKMAQDMVHIIRETAREIKFNELNMRIGIHTVSKHRFQHAYGYLGSTDWWHYRH